jgi:hypothetical protein
LVRLRILLFSSVADRMPTKISFLTFFKQFFCLFLFELHLLQFSKIKSQKEITKYLVEIKVFFTLLLVD